MELNMLINNNYIKNLLNKLINKIIYKKINISAITNIEDIEIRTIEDGNIQIQFNGSINVPNSIIPKLLEMAVLK